MMDAPHPKITIAAILFALAVVVVKLYVDHM